MAKGLACPQSGPRICSAYLGFSFYREDRDDGKEWIKWAQKIVSKCVNPRSILFADTALKGEASLPNQRYEQWLWCDTWRAKTKDSPRTPFSKFFQKVYTAHNKIHVDELGDSDDPEQTAIELIGAIEISLRPWARSKNNRRVHFLAVIEMHGTCPKFSILARRDGRKAKNNLSSRAVRWCPPIAAGTNESRSKLRENSN